MINSQIKNIAFFYSYEGIYISQNSQIFWILVGSINFFEKIGNSYEL
ncbi:hypothetical protein J624_1442 [Acinetobacter baumannii 1062314]|nr:hypothetical protein J624_1442 [Acinetobacter baumannii 1062314]